MIRQKICNRKNSYLFIIAVSVPFITYLHYSTLPKIHELHNIFTELYYMPLLLGSLVFGLRGAILTFIFISVLYIPFMFIPFMFVNWTNTFLFAVNKFTHALFAGSFAILAGYLVDRERDRQRQSEKDHYLSGLGQAATAIVHDLKNPLVTVLGFARRIRQGKGDVIEASQTVIDSAENMQMIVNNVLNFAGPVSLVLNKEDLRSVVNRACDSCKTKAGREEISLSKELPAEPVEIPIDSLHIERALVNLINNAIDASPGGHIVSIAAETGIDSVTVKIKDYGAGMDSETLENVFIPFYTKKSSGTGLGMAIAKKIIEGHQGRICIKSQPGTGTEIFVELSCKQDKKMQM